MSELLNCPHCGGKAVHSEGRKGGNQPWHYVECLSCAAMAEPDVWNRRAAPTVEGKWVARAKLEGVTWHSLRHTWASWHAMSGTPVPVLKELGGWRTLSMVNRYSHLAPEHLRRYAGGAERYLGHKRRPQRR